MYVITYEILKYCRVPFLEFTNFEVFQHTLKSVPQIIRAT